MLAAQPPSIVAISVKDMAERYNVSRSTIIRSIASGALQARKLGRRTLIQVTEAERWFADVTRPVTFSTSK